MKQAALFLDRDGVINRERGEYTFKLEDLDLLPGTIALAKKAISKRMMIVVISNQSGVAKGLYSMEDVLKLEARIRTVYGSKGVEIAEFYYCPHHPKFGKCLCRKPKSLLFEKVISRFDIDPSKSIMIGDKERDIIPAEALGIRGVLIEANSDLSQMQLD